MVKRYSNWCLATHGHDMAPNDLGPYVAHSDYLALQAALKEALDGWEDWCPTSRSKSSMGENARLCIAEFRKLTEE